jgi:hypothetical protein
MIPQGLVASAERPSFNCLIHFYKRWRTLPPPCVSDKKLGSTAKTTAEWKYGITGAYIRFKQYCVKEADWPTGIQK